MKAKTRKPEVEGSKDFLFCVLHVFGRAVEEPRKESPDSREMSLDERLECVVIVGDFEPAGQRLIAFLIRGA